MKNMEVKFKSLLVLMFVAGLASTCSAAVMLSVNGDTTMDEVYICASDWITIDVYDDQANGYMDGLYYLDICPISGGCYSLANPRPDPIGFGDFASWLYYVYGDCDEFEISQSDSQSPSPPPGPIFLVDLHYEGSCPEGVTVSLYNAGLTLLDSLTINSCDPTACFPGTNPDFVDWVNFGEPECWCYPRQCHGDATGYPYGRNNYWVSVPDLTVLMDAWNKSAAWVIWPPRHLRRSVLSKALPIDRDSAFLKTRRICAIYSHNNWY